MNYTTIIFDMDGVLIDSPKYNWEIRNDYFKKNYGFTVSTKKIQKFIGRSLIDQLKEIQKNYSVNLPPYEQLSALFAEKQIELMQKNIFPNTTLNTFLKKEIPHIHKAICTHNIKRNVETYLRWIDLENAFDTVVTIEDVTKHKPNPEALMLTTQRLGVQTNECVVIEDSPKGIESAKKIGMYAIGFLTVFNSEEDLKKAGADMIIDCFDKKSLENIKKLLDLKKQE